MSDLVLSMIALFFWGSVLGFVLRVELADARANPPRPRNLGLRLPNF